MAGFGDLLAKARNGPELEGPLSPVGDWLYSQRAGDGGVVTGSSYARALEQAAEVREMTSEVAPELADAPWTNISGNLPAAPVNDVIVIPGDKLVVGTDVGVFLTTDGGATWLNVGEGLPAVPILDIRYHEGTNSITAATFGHGIQRVVLP